MRWLGCITSYLYSDEQEYGYHVILDLYNLDTGKYLGSIGMPIPTTRIVVREFALYCLQDT